MQIILIFQQHKHTFYDAAADDDKICARLEVGKRLTSVA